MFAIRSHGGMFIRNDGLMTDNRASVKIFDTQIQAKDYFLNEWSNKTGVARAPAPWDQFKIVKIKTKTVMVGVVQEVEDVLWV